jgi:hypothetical protein
MTGEGNHERDWPGTGSISFNGAKDSGGECGVPTHARYPMPVANSSGAEYYYGWRQGPVHFVMMATELPFTPGSAQREFLERELLENVDRTVTPWVVFMGHRPMYYGNASDPRMVAELEPLLARSGVDLAMWGHVHLAQVTCSLLKGACVDRRGDGSNAAPVHAVVGNGGMTLVPLPDPAPAWSEYVKAEFGFSTLRATAETLELSMYGDALQGAPSPLRHVTRLEKPSGRAALRRAGEGLVRGTARRA